jgi:hypothetical protein
MPDETIQDANEASRHLVSESLDKVHEESITSTPDSAGSPKDSKEDRQSSEEIDISAALFASLPITVVDETAPGLQALPASIANSTV